MTFIESLAIALFCMTMVFCILGVICFLIKVFSIGIMKAEQIQKKRRLARGRREGVSIPVSEHKPADQLEQGENLSTGSLKLKNVDEPTAAMIMAIVSDESGIPLSELCFKSIKLVTEKDQITEALPSH